MIKSLKGIRGILALGIFISHLYVLKETSLNNLYSNYLIGLGAYGVLFFFILSGFGIGASYTSKFKGIFKKDTLSFYKKRILTLYPAHIAILVLVIYLKWPYVFHDILGNMKDIIMNITLLYDFTGSVNYNSVTWYLSVLLVCYLLTPLIVAAIKKLDFYKIKLWIVIIIIYVTQVIIVATNLDNPNQRNLFYADYRFRIWDYIIGIIIGYIYAKNKEKIKSKVYNFNKYSIIEILLVALNILVIALRVFVPIPFLHGTYYAPAVVLLIIVLIKDAGIISKLLSTKIVNFFSNISYEFYLVHLVIIEFMIQRIGTSNVPLLIIIEFILSLIISVCVSIGIKVIFKIGNNIRTQYKEKNKV